MKTRTVKLKIPKDSRICQAIYNATNGEDIFHIPDEVLIKLLEIDCKKIKNSVYLKKK